MQRVPRLLVPVLGVVVLGVCAQALGAVPTFHRGLSRTQVVRTARSTKRVIVVLKSNRGASSRPPRAFRARSARQARQRRPLIASVKLVRRRGHAPVHGPERVRRHGVEHRAEAPRGRPAASPPSFPTRWSPAAAQPSRRQRASPAARATRRRRSRRHLPDRPGQAAARARGAADHARRLQRPERRRRPRTWPPARA